MLKIGVENINKKLDLKIGIAYLNYKFERKLELKRLIKNWNWK